MNYQVVFSKFLSHLEVQIQFYEGDLEEDMHFQGF